MNGSFNICLLAFDTLMKIFFIIIPIVSDSFPQRYIINNLIPNFSALQALQNFKSPQKKWAFSWFFEILLVNLQQINKNMSTTKKIIANRTEVSLLLQGNENVFTCLTDMTRYKDNNCTNYIIQYWMRTGNTIEYLVGWKLLYNPNFKRIESAASRDQTKLQS